MITNNTATNNFRLQLKVKINFGAPNGCKIFIQVREEFPWKLPVSENLGMELFGQSSQFFIPALFKFFQILI